MVGDVAFGQPEHECDRARGHRLGERHEVAAARGEPRRERVACPRAQLRLELGDLLLREARLRERAVHLVARLVGGGDHLVRAGRGQLERRGLPVVAAHEHTGEVRGEVLLARERRFDQIPGGDEVDAGIPDARDRVLCAHAREEPMRVLDRRWLEQLGRIRAAERGAHPTQCCSSAASASDTWRVASSCELNTRRTTPFLSITNVTRPGRRPNVLGTPYFLRTSPFASESSVNGSLWRLANFACDDAESELTPITSAPASWKSS